MIIGRLNMRGMEFSFVGFLEGIFVGFLEDSLGMFDWILGAIVMRIFKLCNFRDKVVYEVTQEVLKGTI